jgi:hypothetical protein
MFYVLHPFVTYLLTLSRRCAFILESEEHFVTCDDVAANTDTNVIRFRCVFVLRDEPQSVR